MTKTLQWIIKSITVMMGRWRIRLFPEVNSLTVSGRKVETIENSGPIFAVSSITGHRIVDMEIFAAVTYMLGCTFCKHWYSFAGRL